MKTMFRVIFRTGQEDGNLTQWLMLPVVPDKGERVSIHRADTWRVSEGVVTERIWAINDADANASQVVVVVALDQKRR